ncbi:ABC transporter ATP-binding protein [Cellulomonas sp. Root485]|uniref:ABC transporter ATP-binding protein n=1 Tax=Cellulomonas sp. Root485 TaxID=1736546 RepID=UPI0009E6B1A2
MATHPRGLTVIPERSAVPPPVHGVLADERTATTDGTVVVRDLVRAYGLGEGDGRVLRGLDLSIAAGEFVAILGRSGSGKSTLLRALAGLDHDVHGTGTIAVPDRVSVVFQDSRLLPWARVLDNVTLGLRGPRVRELGVERLAEVGLAGRERAWPTELSGGEQQRVSLARSLVREPQLLLADEPFGALDALTRIRMHGLLRDLCARHEPAVLLVTHDVDEAIVLADRVIVLDAGRIALHVEVGIDGPRDPADPRFADLRAQLLAALGVPLTERTVS